MNRVRKLLHRMGYKIILVFIYLLVSLLFRLKIKGKQNIPEETRNLLIVSTHTSYWDPPLIGLAMGLFREVHFIARAGLLKNPIFLILVKAYSTVINRDDFKKKDLIKMLRAFQSDDLLCIFPEGTTREGVSPKSGTVRLAEKTDRKFLPVKITLSRSPTQAPFLFAPVEVIIGKSLTFSELREIQSAKSSTNERGKSVDEIDYNELSKTLMRHINGLNGDL